MMAEACRLQVSRLDALVMMKMMVMMVKKMIKVVRPRTDGRRGM